LLAKKALPMSMVGFPLLLIPLAIYNIIVFLMPGVSFAEPLFKVTLMSGAEWQITLTDILLALGVLMLLLEVVKGARPGAKYLTDHLLSFVVFGAAAAEFLLWPKFGTSTYCLLTLLSLSDFLSSVALRARRGAGTVRATAASAPPARPVERQPEPLRPEPKLEVPPAAPPPAAPSAAPMAEESALPDRVDPKPAQTSPDEPTVASPGLQPASGSTASPEQPQH
jgi:hypothetical protein